MSILITEDGTKPENANGYITLDYADDYHTLYGNADWEGLSDDEKELAIVHSTRALDLLYGRRYLSSIPPGSNQSLLWPRYAFYDNNNRYVGGSTIPKVLKDALCELSLLSGLGTDVYAKPTSEGTTTDESFKVDDIQITTKYSKALEPAETYTGYYKIEIMLSDILASKTVPLRLSR